MTQLELIMAFFECTEREARWIAAIDAGTSPGDLIEVEDDD